MNIGLIIFIIVAILLWAFIRKKVENSSKSKEMNFVSTEKVEENIELNELFFEEVRNGEKTHILTNTFDQFDLIFIKSLFQAEQIPYHIEFEHFTRVYPFLNSATIGGEIIYILEKNYNDVTKLIEEYNKRKNIPNGT